MNIADKMNIRDLYFFFWILFLILCLSTRFLFSQTLREDLWFTDGFVESITTDDGIIYVGGTFSLVGPKIQGFAVLDTTTGEATPLLPGLSAAIRDITPDGQGGWYAGGTITTNNTGLLAHLHQDGSLDTWNLGSSNIIESIALADSILYVGGSFSTIDGQTRNNIAAFNTLTGQLTEWNPDVNNRIRELAVSGSRLYIGGSFTSVDGQIRNCMAAFDRRTGDLIAWDPDASSDVMAILVVDSTIYVGGTFYRIGGQVRAYLAALDSATAAATDWNPDAESSVHSLANLDSIIYVGGIFNRIGGLGRGCIAAINMHTGVPTPWDPGINEDVACIVISGNTIFVGGRFTNVAGAGRRYAAAIDALTGTVTPWNPVSNSWVYSLFVSGSDVYIGGDFFMIGADLRNNAAAIDSISGRATEWNPNVYGGVSSILVTDSIIYLGGNILTISGEQRNGIGAVEKETGNLTSWNPDVSNRIREMAISGSNIIAGGTFTSIGGQSRNRIAAIDMETGIPTPWNPDINGTVLTIAASEHIVYAGGLFSTVGGQARTNIAAIDIETGIASDWSPDANDNVWDITLSGDRIYVGGEFTNIGGAGRTRIAAFDTATGNVTSWNPGANDDVRSIFLSGSTVYIGGRFDYIKDQTRNWVGAVDVETGNVLDWNPILSNYVDVVKASGSTVYIGGGFARLNNILHPYFAALTAYEEIQAGLSMQFSSDSLVFPPMPVGEILDNTVTIYNSGSSDLNITSREISGENADEYSIIEGSGPTTIIAGDSQQVKIRLSPAAAGLKVAFLVINSNAETSPDTIHLTGAAFSLSGWYIQNSSITDYLWDVHFTDSQNGWAVGEPGIVLHTTNGGITWLRENIGTSNTCMDVFFTDSLRGWITGSMGFLFKTINGGESWNQQDIGTTATLNEITFTDTQTGWIAGSGGSIFKTADGGDTWSAQTSTVTRILSSVSFVDNQTGWIVGESGTILHTTDGGDTWTLQPIANTSWLMSVFFFDSQVGLAAGFSGTILRTTDGGTTWVRQASGTTNALYSVFFTNQQTGWAVGGNGTLQYTEDGGISWTAQESGTIWGLSSVFFSDALSGWAVGGNGTILHTLDAGGTGQPTLIELSSININFPPTPVDQNNDLELYISNPGISDLEISSKTLAGINASEFSIIQGGGASTITPGDSQQVVLQFSPENEGQKSALLIITSNAPSSPDTVILNGTAITGEGWYTQYTGVAYNYYDCHFINTTTGWVTSGPNILHTNNGGNSWSTLNTGISDALVSISFHDENLGWAVGINGTIIHTDDSGQNWTRQFCSSSSSLQSVHFINADTGWIAGPGGGIWRTTNGGNSWPGQSSGTSYVLQDVFFINADTGWACGNQGTILFSSDGGSTWLPQTSNVTSAVHSIHFIDTQYGWAVGTDGLILHSSDGGTTWSEQISGTTNELIYVCFTDIQMGWAAGGNGTILNTIDGGLNWTAQNSKINSPIWSVFFVDNNIGWATSSGVILHTINGGQAGINSEIAFSSDILQFPHTNLNESNDLPITIYNYGNTDLNIFAKDITGPGGGEFSFIQGGSPSTVASHDSEIVVLRFAPTASGSRNAYFIVESDAISSPDTITLVGNNFPEVILPSPIFKEEIGLTIIPPNHFFPDSSLLYYRMAGERGWHSKDLLYDGDEYTAIIDSNYATIRGIEYYIYFTDSDHQIITYPPLNPRENPAIIQVQVGQLATNTILQPEKYKMISIPLELPNGSIDELFLDDYGEYNKEQWRLLSWNQSQEAYDEYPDIQPSFIPGMACWLITRSGRGFDIEDGLSVASDSPVSLAIQSGWNQIGNPFAFTVVWDSVANSSLLNSPVYWNGDDYEYAINELIPWEGYFVFNDSSAAITLSFPPRESGSHLGKSLQSEILTPPQFIMQLILRGATSEQPDEQNFVGMLESATNNFDREDFPEAPAIVKKTELSIVQDNRRYAGNFKAVSEKGACWDIVINSTENEEKVMIEFEPLTDIDKRFDIWMLDMDRYCCLEMSDNKCKLNLKKAAPEINLRLIIGTPEFAQTVNEGISLVPFSFNLEQNFPNPFNPQTIINYQIGIQSHVRLDIFNILGQNIQTLVNQEQEPGHYQIRWSGENLEHSRVGSGVYFYRLKAGDYVKTKKMLIIR